MRRHLALLLFLAPSTALVVLAACSADPAEVGRLPTTPDREGGKKTDSTVDPPEEQDGGGGDLPEASTGPGRVYAHTRDTLYLYEPVSKQLTEIAKFAFDKFPSDIIDIAVDRTGNMYGTTFNDFFRIDSATAQCTHIRAAVGIEPDYPNALSFVPAGTADPGKEVLVGYASKIGDNLAVNYVQIDTTTGAMTPLGNMNAGTTGPQYRSSGDLVSIIDDGKRTYATVKLQTDGGLEGDDLLAEVDPVDGHVKRIIGDTKQSDLFGFGYWAGKGYGFSFKSGGIVEIDMTNGSSVVLKTLTNDAGVALPWYGAGSTTQAPAR